MKCKHHFMAKYYKIVLLFAFLFIKQINLAQTPSLSEITLKVVTEEDIPTVWEMQVSAFSDLLEKYQDYDMSPAAKVLIKSWQDISSPGQHTISL